MRVFIDTNIYLNFYRMSNESLSAFQEILRAMEEGKLELLVPKQIEREFWKNKNAVAKVFANEQKKIMKSIPSLDVAPILRHTREVKSINANRKRLLERQNKLLGKYEERVTNPKSKLNRLIGRLFQEGTKIQESNETLERAYKRYLRKDPPRKRKNDESLGDAIIWETILERFTDEDLYIVAVDGDWVDPMDTERLNELMMREWEERSGGVNKVVRYASLSQFVKKHLHVKGVAIERAVTEETELGKIDSLLIPTSITMAPGIFNTATIFDGFGTSATLASSQICKHCHLPAIGQTLYDGQCATCVGHYSIFSPSILGITRCRKCGKEINDSRLALSIIDNGLCKECHSGPLTS